jgi:hypothetical protein
LRPISENNIIDHSNVNKSTRAKVAVIFVHFRFSVISFRIIMQQLKSEFASNTSSHFLIVSTTQKTITLIVDAQNKMAHGRQQAAGSNDGSKIIVKRLSDTTPLGAVWHST